MSPDKLAERFRRELEALSGHVHPVEDIEEIAPEIVAIAQRHQAGRILAWNEAALGIPWLKQALAEAGIVITQHQLTADEAERKAQLNDIDEVMIGLTGAQGGLADTGSLALVSGPGRGRLASLLPPVHIAILSKRNIYPSLPPFLAANPDVTVDSSNLVFISGPSRTGDIEMTLSMGVHGPGEVHVIITP
jgi:L-lactate dehydrogenase complex protein LldG